MSPERARKLAIDTVWVIVAGCMVFLMQAGFAMLEVGFSRGKNVGAVVAKILVNLSIGTIAFWAVGFAPRVRQRQQGVRHRRILPAQLDCSSSLSFSDVPLSAKFLFEVVFCTVSLAIVWGTMLDRTKFGVYVVFAIVFAALIYPLVGHWIWGGGFLAERGMQDFAGSTVVHLCGATAALAGTLMLGARIGKFDSKGKAHPIPGHSMPLAILGVLILWFGWFGFNPGSTLGAVGARFADIAVTTNLAAAAGVLGAIIAGFAAPAHDRHRLRRQRRDRGPGRHHGALRLRRGLGRVRDRPGRRHPHGLDRRRDRPRPRRRPDRRHRRPRHGRHLGHALVRPLHDAPRWPSTNGVGERRPVLRRRAAPARRPGARHRRAWPRSCSPRARRSSTSARRRSACASTRSRSSRASTSTSTACGATPSSSCPATARPSPTSWRPTAARRPGPARRSRPTSAVTTEGGD